MEPQNRVRCIVPHATNIHLPLPYSFLELQHDESHANISTFRVMYRKAPLSINNIGEKVGRERKLENSSEVV